MATYFEAAPGPILAAEFHYFRLPREKWELLLIRLRQMGINTLTLTLPWGFHEFEPGTIDLNGSTHNRRDIAGLVRLCAALNFVCLLNPGPYAPADGVLGDGLPLWLLKQTDDLEPSLPEAVSGWYGALSDALTSQQWPNGPIIALHVESTSGKNQAQSLSPQLTEVKWPIWLRKQYGNIEALNTAYGTAYRTVNEIKFPDNWSAAVTPLEKDAQLFLETARGDAQTSYRQRLLDHGWHVPIYASDLETRPPWHNINLTDAAEFVALSQPQKTAVEPLWLNLQQPIQADPDPVDVGCGPVWAKGAPIQADGLVRITFWQVRQHLWSYLRPEAHLAEQTLIIPFANGHILTRSGDAWLKIDLPAPSKHVVRRLHLTGELVVDDNLRFSRNKLSGRYLAEDAAGQTDFILLLNDSPAGADNFLLGYLRHLLTAQVYTLSRSAGLVAALRQTLIPGQATTDAPVSAQPAQTSYGLEEARRGLRDADAALRKALGSISALEGGFATMLGQETAQPAAAPLAINPAIFEGQAKNVLLAVGAACVKIEPVLTSAVDSLQPGLATSSTFTLEQYLQGYATAVTTAEVARGPLLDLLALLRLEIAAERLPLVAWRVHNQVQEIIESLRWGILRG
jgi:hypothetical protein